jgi:hypothetical protein
MNPPLRILGGRAALSELRERGLRLGDFDVLVAPAGGTKFLALAGLDRVLFPALRATVRSAPIHCVGSSIGSFRLAGLACKDPGAALDRLAEAYIGLDERAQPADASAVLVSALLGDEPRDTIADPPFARLHVLTNRCRGLAASALRPLLLAGLGLAQIGNMWSRSTLAWQLARVVFHSRGEAGPLGALRDLPTEHAALTPHNLESVLAASAAVPLLVPGVTIPGGPEGIHRDAALLDYHPVLSFPRTHGLVLYPHFYEHFTPGWFDRPLPHRRARGGSLDRTVVLAPSDDFVARLPGGMLPSRRDVRRFAPSERRRRWRAVLELGAELGDALGEYLTSPARVAKDAVALRTSG